MNGSASPVIPLRKTRDTAPGWLTAAGRFVVRGHAERALDLKVLLRVWAHAHHVARRQILGQLDLGLPKLPNDLVRRVSLPRHLRFDRRWRNEELFGFVLCRRRMTESGPFSGLAARRDRES